MKKTAKLDREILAEIYGASSIPETLHQLCDVIGTRFAGSAGEAAAARYVRSRFRSFGLSRARLETFSFTGWDRGETATLTVTAPVRKRFTVTALPFSPDSGTRGFSGPVAVLWDGTPEAFRDAGKALKKALVLTREGVPPSYPRSVHRAEKFGRAVEAEAGAFLFAHPDPGGLDPTGCARFGREAEIPAAGLSFENAEFLRRLARRGPVRATLKVSGKTRRKRSQNVIAEIEGSSSKGESIVVGGHLDSHDVAPGARDNASGVCVVLEAARALSVAGFRPAHTLRFIAFGVEEFGLIGSTRHAEALGPDAGKVRWMINVDSPPQSEPLGFQIHRCGRARAFFRKLSLELGREIPVLPGLHNHSDHFPFFLKGIAVANLASPGSGHKGGRGWGHTAADTPDKVNLSAMQRASELVARTLVRLASNTGLRLPPRSAEEVGKILRDEGFEERIRYEN